MTVVLYTTRARVVGGDRPSADGAMFLKREEAEAHGIWWYGEADRFQVFPILLEKGAPPDEVWGPPSENKPFTSTYVDGERGVGGSAQTFVFGGGQKTADKPKEEVGRPPTHDGSYFGDGDSISYGGTGYPDKDDRVEAGGPYMTYGDLYRAAAAQMEAERRERRLAASRALGWAVVSVPALFMIGGAWFFGAQRGWSDEAVLAWTTLWAGVAGFLWTGVVGLWELVRGKEEGD